MGFIKPRESNIGSPRAQSLVKRGCLSVSSIAKVAAAYRSAGLNCDA
jgi:hypothetical protein